MTQRWARFNHDTFQMLELDPVRIKRTALALKDASDALNPGDPSNPDRPGYKGAWELWESCKDYVENAIQGRIREPLLNGLPSSGYERDFDLPQPFYSAFCAFESALLGNPGWVSKDKERSLAFLDNPEQFMKQEDGQWYIWEEFEDNFELNP